MDSNFKRFTIISQKNPNTGAYDLAGAPKDIRSIVNSYLKSALEENEFFKVTERKIDKSGRVSVDVFVHADKASLVEKAKRQAEEKFQFIDEGNQIGEKYHITKARPVTTEQLSLLQAEERRPQEIIVEKEQQKALKIKQAEEVRKQKQADREAKAEEQRKKQEEKKEQAEARAQARHTHSALLKVIGVATVGVGILRRILTSVLTFATKTQRDMIQSQNIGISYPLMRQYSLVEKAHGLQEGTFMGGLQALQQAFGNITSLDDKKLSDLAVVMGSEVTEAVKMGLGQSNPDKLMQMIVDKFSERANAGYNSIGQYVGQPQAQRELYSYLQKIFPELATIFGTMQEEQHNISSLHRQEVATLSDFVNSAPATGIGSTIDYNVTAVLGQEWQLVTKRMDEIVTAIKNDLALPLQNIFRKINNWRFGLSEADNAKLNAENKQKNQKQLDNVNKVIATMEEAQAQGKLSENDTYYLETLRAYKADLVKALAGNKKGNIDDATKNSELLREEAREYGTYMKALKKIDKAEKNPEGLYSDEDLRRVFESGDHSFLGVDTYDKLIAEYNKEQGIKDENAYKKAKEKRDKQIEAERKKAPELAKKQAMKEAKDEVTETNAYIRPLYVKLKYLEKLTGENLSTDAEGKPLKLNEQIARAEALFGAKGLKNVANAYYDLIIPKDIEIPQEKLEEQMPTLKKPFGYTVKQREFWDWLSRSKYKGVFDVLQSQEEQADAEWQETENKFDTFISFPGLQEQVNQKVSQKGAGNYTVTLRGENTAVDGQLVYKLLVDIKDSNGKVTSEELTHALNKTGFSGVVGESTVTIGSGGKVTDYQSMLSEGASSAKQAMQGGKK